MQGHSSNSTCLRAALDYLSPTAPAADVPRAQVFSLLGLVSCQIFGTLTRARYVVRLKRGHYYYTVLLRNRAGGGSMCSNGMEANFFFDPPEFIETRRDVLLACSEIHLEASLATSDRPPTTNAPPIMLGQRATRSAQR